MVVLRIIILTLLKCLFNVQAVGICWRRNTGATGSSAFSFGFVTRPELASFSSEHFFKLSCDSCLLWASCTVIRMFVVEAFCRNLLYFQLAEDKVFE